MTFIYPVDSNAAHPLPLSPEYKSSIKRAPSKPLIPMRHTLSELTGPVYGHETVRDGDNDLTTQHKGEPLGERLDGGRRRSGPCLWSGQAELRSEGGQPGDPDDRRGLRRGRRRPHEIEGLRGRE